MDKLVIDKLIVVEGKYDKITLENIVDADIFVVNGFSVFKNRKIKESLKLLSKGRGVIVLTDSDTAGYKIRVYLSKILCNEEVVNVFLPQIVGKEKRKERPSAEGFVGVEGVNSELLYSVLSEYQTKRPLRKEIDTVALYNYGFTGKENSKQRKKELCDFLGVQPNISNGFLLRLLNYKYTLKQFIELPINKEYEV